MLQSVKISIITATWNCIVQMADCVNAVANQTYTKREHIIIDGGSTDGTLEYLLKNRNIFDLLTSEKDNGIYDTLNKGINFATGEIIGFLHSDDLYRNNDTLIRQDKICIIKFPYANSIFSCHF